MDIPKELSFSLFLMLMLFKTVVSLPVGNNNQFLNVKPTTELSYETLVKTNKTLIELFPYLSTQPYRNFTGRLRSLARQELIYGLIKLRDIAIRINSAENKKNFIDLLAHSSNEKLARTWTFSLRDDLVAVRVSINDLASLINSPKTDRKLKDVLDALPDKESKKTFKALAESFKHFVYQQFNNVKAKYDDFENRMKPIIKKYLETNIWGFDDYYDPYYLNSK